MSRYRERTGDYVSGSVTRKTSITTVVNSSGHKTLDTVTDVTGPGDGNFFEVNHYSADDGFLADGVISVRTWSTFPLNAFRIPQQRNSHAPVTVPPNEALAAQLLAMTNPGRPDIDLPVFFKELPDVIHILRVFDRIKLLFQRGFIQEALGFLASANLTVEFGIKPLVKDLQSLLAFHDNVENRLAELRELQKSGLRRKRSLGNFSGKSSEPEFTADSSTSYSIRYSGTIQTSVEKWGYVRWFPTGDFRSYSDQKLRKLAQKSVLGLNVDLATAWQAMPWSWLADWFSNVGDLLEANRRGIPATHSTPQIMTRTISISKYTNDKKYPDILPEDHYRTRTTLRRDPTPASLVAYMPALSGRQIAILGSLAVLKSENRDRFSRLSRGG